MTTTTTETHAQLVARAAVARTALIAALEAERQKMGLTQVRFASSIGIHPTILPQFYGNHRHLSHRSCTAIIAHLPHMAEVVNEYAKATFLLAQNLTVSEERAGIVTLRHSS